jgi:hypothetical protein
MRYSRRGIVLVLLAAEVFIGGAILWSLGGGRWPAGAAAVNNMSELAQIDAGQAPHIIVDDPSNRVVITASADGKVHVTDHTHIWGWYLGARSNVPLTVSRIADGVVIRRGDGGTPAGVAFFGVYFKRTDIAVPPNARLEIQRCDGATVDGVQAGDVKIACSDGSLHFSDLQTASIDANTGDGSIKATNLRVGGGTLRTNDGSIRVALADGNLTVRAQTNDGSIRFNGARAEQSGDSGSADYQVGTGGGPLQLSTQDGSIHITTNGALLSHE